MSVGEDDVIARAVGGDHDALAKLLEQLGPGLRGQLIPEMPTRWQSILGVDDVLQQTYSDAFLDIRSVKATDINGLRAWLVRLAKRNIIDAVRMLEAAKRGGGRLQVEVQNREDSYVALHEMLGAVSNAPSRDARRREAVVALDRALARLPDAHRTVVTRYDLEGQPIGEVARAVGRSEGATYMLRARAHRMLAEMIGGASKYFGDSM
jgi:RNA polymerase sigma-70 factor (ECF subfamily)